LIKKHKDELERAVQKLAEKNNPTLLSIKKVEKLFKDRIEFDSRSQLLRELGGSMKATVLNTIVAHLVFENKLIVNDDHSLTWIDTARNEKLNKEFSKAVPL
jgi:citrate lyase gamma subunit